MRLQLLAIALALIGAPVADAQTYRTPSQASAVDQLHQTPSIVDPNGNPNTDPAMTSSTGVSTPAPARGQRDANCRSGTASSEHPDNTDNPPMTPGCGQ